MLQVSQKRGVSLANGDGGLIGRRWENDTQEVSNRYYSAVVVGRVFVGLRELGEHRVPLINHRTRR